MSLAEKVPPVLGFSAFPGSDAQARTELLAAIKEACEDKGFFQLTNHGITTTLQDQMLSASREFFDLPLEEKLKIKLNSYNHGYETIGAQMLEPGSAPDTKEAIYIGEDLAPDSLRVIRGDYSCGPNLWPEKVGEVFKDTTNEHFLVVRLLTVDVMRALAFGLGLEENWFDRSTTSFPAATLRLVHYPPTP